MDPTTLEGDSVTTIQDRAKMISDMVNDATTRQMQDAVIADPVCAGLRAFITRAVDGVYLNGADGEPAVFISKEEYGPVQVEELVRLVGERRAEMLKDARYEAEKGMTATEVQESRAEAEVG